MAAVTDLVFVALVGIMDPLRAEAKEAVHTALAAGIDVRMITGDHTVTARAIADELGLGPGVITGTELQHLPDAEVIERLPELHVFGRVAPEDKLRLARLMQESGQVVAMTGDAVNDAAALKQADIGVAMGSGSEVSKQAAKIVLTDDNFATLVRAVDLGRDIYRRISTYVRLQLTILSAVLQLMVYATIFNINGGVALFPMQLLFCKFFVVVTVVIGFIVDVPDPRVMHRPPREPGTKIVNRPQVVRWLITGFVVAATALAVLEWGPGTPSTKHPSVCMTMAFAIVSLSAVNIGLIMRRERRHRGPRRCSPSWAGSCSAGSSPGPPSSSACSSGCSTPCRSPEGSGSSSSRCHSSPRGRRGRQSHPATAPAPGPARTNCAAEGRTGRLGQHVTMRCAGDFRYQVIR